MKHSGQQLIEQLRSRGLVAQVSGDEELESGFLRNLERAASRAVCHAQRL